MKFKDIPGEYAFKALVEDRLPSGRTSWMLSSDYYFSLDEVLIGNSEGKKFKWPVRVDADGDCYVIDPSEYEEEK